MDQTRDKLVDRTKRLIAECPAQEKVLSAWLNNERIEYKHKDSDVNWRTTNMPRWNFKHVRYRIAPAPIFL